MVDDLFLPLCKQKINMQKFQHLMRRALLAAAVVATVSVGSLAQDMQSKLPKDPDVITGKLDNGLVYYIRPNHKPEKKVELRLVVKAGSILENNDQLGLAHFMEHMNFNGTTNFQKNDLVSYLQSIGVQFGADLNAYTSFDQTVYILPIPTDKPGNLEKGFQIIEDWAHNALLTNQDIDDERGVVLEESRLGKGANDRMRKKYLPKLAEGSLYADRLPIGKDEILKTFKYEKIRAFYHDWYRPDLQAVVVVGDIDAETAKKMIMQHFGKLKNPAGERARKYVEVSPRKAPEAMVVTDKEASQSVLLLTFPFTKKHDEVTLGDYRADMVKNIAVQMLNRRLSDLTKGANPPFPYAGIDFEGLIHGYQSVEAYALFGPDGPEKPLMALTAEIEKAKKFGFNESELELVKKEMLSSVEKEYNERTTTESKDYVEEYIRAFLDNEAFPGIANEYNYTKQMLPGITVKDINEEVKKLFANENTFSLIMAPDKPEVKLPTDQDLLAMTTRGFKQEVKQEAEQKVASSLIDKKPAPGTVVGTFVKDDALGTTTYTLSNGIKVTFKTTDFKSDEILVRGIKKGGTNSYGVADKNNVAFATDVTDAMGYGNFTPAQLEKVLAGKKVELDQKIEEIDDQITGSSTVKDFETLMQLTYLAMTQPRKDEELFKGFKDKMKAQLAFMASNPQAAFIDTMVKSLYNNNPLARRVIPKPADFDDINLDRALQIYKDEIGSPDGYHFVIVGNIKAEEALPLIQTYLGGIPSTGKPAAFKDNGVRPVKGNKELKIHKGKDPKSLIVAIYSGEMPYSEDLSLKTQAVAEVLNIKVIENLREKMGKIYGGGFRGSVSKEPYERYSIQLQLPCGPQSVDTLLSAANNEIKTLIANGPDAKDLEKVKSQWREKYRTDVKDNKYWADKLQSTLFWGRDKDRVLKYESYIDKLTPADIQATARALFGKANTFVSVLYPES
jgi:zinc protease